MTTPSPHPPNPLKSASDQDTSANSSRQRSQPQARGHSTLQSSTRRGLTPISTSFSANNPSRPGSSSQNRNPWSPNAVGPASFNRAIGRSSSISSASSPFSSPPPSVAAGQQHQQQQQQSQSHHSQQPYSSQTSNPNPSLGKSRNIASSGHPQAASAAAASHGSGVGGSSSGGSTRSFRASPALSQSNFGSPAPATLTSLSASQNSNQSQSGSLSKITIAQIFLLLSTIKEDKDKSKWDSQAEQIRKLVDSNGMEVFTKYFRRLLVTNAAHIWNTGRGTEQTGNYQILVSEMQKIGKDLAQASKIVESIEYGEGEIFKDFDLSTFMDHFRMDPIAKITLAYAFKKSSKADLRTKADAIVTKNLQYLFGAIRQTSSQAPEQNADQPSVELLSIIIDHLAQDPPRNWNVEMHHKLLSALQNRFEGMHIPLEISSAVQAFDLLKSNSPLVQHLQKIGPKVTESQDACRTALEAVDLRDISYQQVANALLFMVIAKDDPPYDPKVFIAALRENRGGQRLDWQDVVQSFDRENLTITRQQFKRLFDALLPLAKDYENFDIQLLWGGDWHHENTQLNFASAFVSFSEEELDADTIPRLRRGFTMEDVQDASDEVKTYAETAVRHPLVSIDATKTLFNVIFRSSETYAQAQGLGVVENIINRKMDLFVSSISAVPKPWGALQDQAIKQLFSTIFMNEVPGQDFALHLVWKRDMTWVATRLLHIYQQDSSTLQKILEVAHAHGWLNELIGVNNELSLDLAALAHGRGLFNIESWLEQIAQAMRRDRLVAALSQFLRNKADDDIQAHREQAIPQTVPLSVKTVYALLNFLGNEGISEDERTSLQRICISAYPRLINYGEGFDAIIDSNGQNGNSLTADVDARMQDHYKLMYSGESKVRDVVEILQKYKVSEDAMEQDLFACMIYGLFDEYNCFAEYPDEALGLTAVLFGSTINFDLLSRIALQVAIAMVLDAIRDHPSDANMHKFGLQALIHFKDRLTEWSRLSDLLLEIPSLRGTQIYPILEQSARERQAASNGESNDRDAGATAGAADDFLAPEPRVPEFTCLSVDPPSRPDFFNDPDEKIQEAVLFILNNVSERNLEAKTTDLKSKLQEDHFQWFANYLVESRIKPQPNFHELYMNLLNKFDDKSLWSEVLRETYVSTIRMLNAETTMNSSTERTNLKNLGSWLGSMTIARNQTIKYRNISFKDLLIEAHDSQRLTVAIPFTCKVLTTAAKSIIFRPPCSWTMEIVQILIELYQFSELRLNMKFEIEVLCKALDLEQKDIEPSEAIRSRPAVEEDAAQPMLPDGLEPFNDLPLINYRGGRTMTERLSPSVMVPDLSELPGILKHNYTLPPSNAAIQTRIRHLLSAAVERAVSEIIGPVVERSVTIAAISTSQLIQKDFALEPAEDRYQAAAHTAVKALAGSLAGVTCKEPLRASMANNIQMLCQDLPKQSLPQGSILMFVNDNLDTVCSIVEKQAETASIAEIDAQIEEAIQTRKSGTYREPTLNRWAFYIPEPYRPTPGGLNQNQLSIYEDFVRPSRPMLAHNNNNNNNSNNNGITADPSRQLSDVLQDQFTSVPGLSNPADITSLPHQTMHQQMNQHSNGIQQNTQHLINGYTDGQTLADQVLDFIAGLNQAANDAIDESSSRQLLESASVQEWWQRLRDVIMTAGILQKDQATMNAASELIRLILTDQQRPAVTEFLARVLRSMCSISDITSANVQKWCFELDEDQLFNTNLAIALIKSHLLDWRRVDLLVSKALQQRKPIALSFMQVLVERMLLGDVPGALRADLASSLSTLTSWSFADPNSNPVNELLSKLRVSSPNIGISTTDLLNVKEARANYVFEEWTRLQQNDSPTPALITFVLQLQSQDVLESKEQSAIFFRTCVDSSVLAFEQEEARVNVSVGEAYQKVDALAKLIIMLVTHQGSVNGGGKVEKSTYFDGTLSLLVLILSRHYHERGDRFNSKVFFRLFSILLVELHGSAIAFDESYSNMVYALARALFALQPQIFPGFAFAWLSLVSHRILIPGLLNSPTELGCDLFCGLLERHLSFAGELMKTVDFDPAAKDYYRGTLRLLLVLHHDFPEFLGEYHFRLLCHIPIHCTQMRSLIVSASPTSFPDAPHPFSEGFKADRPPEMKRAPVIRADISGYLQKAGILDAVDEYLNGNTQQTALVDRIISAICNPVDPKTGIGFVRIPVDASLLNALVIHVAKHAESLDRSRPLAFSSMSPHARLVDILVEKLQGEARYHLIGAIVNQLRFPNSHTYYFSSVMFHIFRPGQTDRVSLDIQQQITRLLLERIVVHRPHPWGLIVTLLEFLKNPVYRFWELPFVKAAPEIERMFAALYQQMEHGTRS